MLARIALRIATIQALKGKTLVGDNVLDSEITALDTDADGNLTSDQQRPFITVYTGDSKAEGGREIRSLHKSGPTELIIETAIAATMTYRNEAGEKEVAAGVAATDDAFEFFLDVVGRQIANALSDPQDAWAEVWRSLSTSVTKIERKRTSDASGARIAAHQLVITLDLLPDPVYGEPLAPTSTWAKLFSKLEEPTLPNPDMGPENPEATEFIMDPDISARVELMRSLIGPTSDINAMQVRRRFGLTEREAEAMLLTPQAGADVTTDLSEVEIQVQLS